MMSVKDINNFSEFEEFCKAHENNPKYVADTIIGYAKELSSQVGDVSPEAIVECLLLGSKCSLQIKFLLRKSYRTELVV